MFCLLNMKMARTELLFHGTIVPITQCNPYIHCVLDRLVNWCCFCLLIAATRFSTGATVSLKFLVLLKWYRTFVAERLITWSLYLTLLRGVERHVWQATRLRLIFINVLLDALILEKLLSLFIWICLHERSSEESCRLHLKILQTSFIHPWAWWSYYYNPFHRSKNNDMLLSIFIDSR